MKIHILELEKHRNETTFRPYLNASPTFYEHGIEFSANDPDVYFVGQASIINRNVPLAQSVEQGCEFLSKLDKPYVLFDGQDSSSLMGVWDVFKRTAGIKFAKNVILRNYEDYTNKYINGRWFWGESATGYSVPCEDIDFMNKTLVRSGTNWLNTFGNRLNFRNRKKNKKYDVAVLIGLVGDVYDFGNKVSDFYNGPRKKLFDVVSKLKCKVITTEKTGKLNQKEYFDVLADSKFCVSPFGFGEVNIREIECLVANTVLIKPDIGKIKTDPHIYGESFSLTCSDDFSDISDLIERALANYDEISSHVDNQRSKFVASSNDEYIVNHVINNILT